MPVPLETPPCKNCHEVVCLSISHPVEESLPSQKSSLFSKMLRKLVLSTVTLGSKFVMEVMNETKVYNSEKLSREILLRSPGRPLITVANHTSTVDDPMLLAAITPWSLLTSPSASRWGWCAQEFCFTNPIVSAFFTLGKVFAVRRGGGLYQPAMSEAMAHMQSGHWMHVFPEGKCDQDGKGVSELRWGIGKLIADSSVRPVVVPFVHRGMERVMPFGSMIPKSGHKVRVLVGDPIQFDDIFDRFNKLTENNPGWGDPWPPRREELYIALTKRVHRSMASLDRRLVERVESDEGAAGRRLIRSTSSNLEPGASVPVPGMGSGSKSVCYLEAGDDREEQLEVAVSTPSKTSPSVRTTPAFALAWSAPRIELLHGSLRLSLSSFTSSSPLAKLARTKLVLPAAAVRPLQ